MPFDDVLKRLEEQAIVMGRVDENIKMLKESALAAKSDFEVHKKDDNDRFSIINRAIWLASGGLSVIIFFTNLVWKH